MAAPRTGVTVAAGQWWDAALAGAAAAAEELRATVATATAGRRRGGTAGSARRALPVALAVGVVTGLVIVNTAWVWARVVPTATASATDDVQLSLAELVEEDDQPPLQQQLRRNHVNDVISHDAKPLVASLTRLFTRDTHSPTLSPTTPTSSPTTTSPTNQPTVPTSSPSFSEAGVWTHQLSFESDEPLIDARYRVQPDHPWSYLSNETLLAKPLCRNATYVAACHEWLLTQTQFDTYRARVDAKRAVDRAAGRKHPRCPLTPDYPVVVLLRAFPEDWNKNLADTVAVSTCPVKCQAVTGLWETPVTSVAVDFFDVNPDIPVTNAVWGVLESEDKAGMRDRMLGRIDFLISYTRRADVWINYAYEFRAHEDETCWNPRNFARLTHFIDRCVVPPPTLQQLREKKKLFAAAFVSNCNGLRYQFMGALLAELKRLLPPDREVHSFGGCHHSPPDIKEPPGGKQRVLANYKFSLSFENSWRQDYLTEKQLQSQLAGTVPVVWAAPEAKDFMVGGETSIIHAMDFASPEALARFLVDLDADHERYLSYFRYRTDWRLQNRNFALLDHFDLTGRGQDSFVCRACVVFKREFC